MSIQQLNPYIQFNGDAQAAIRLYETALGAKTEHLMRWGEGPGMQVPADHAKRVMHSLLRIGEGRIMVSDAAPGEPVPNEGNVQILLDFTDAAEMRKKFDALAEGGTVVMAPHDTFWGATFGVLTDRHGVRWLFNCEKKTA